MKRLVQAFFAFVLLAMLGATVRASLDRDVVTALRELLPDPWMQATLFDTYFAFLTCYLVIFYRERSWIARLLWLPAVLLLGSIAIAGYFLMALWQIGPDGSWTEIFQPKKRLDDGSSNSERP